MKTFFTLKRLSRALDVGIILMLVVGVFILGPWVETRFFPVYSKFQIVSVEPIGDTQAKVIFRFTKYRQCDPQGFAWYTGEIGGAFRQLAVTVNKGSPPAGIRPLGVQETSPYIIDVPAERIRNATFAEIYNRCHPFWTTRSDIFP